MLSKREAFTLIEVISALTVFVIGAVLMFSIFSGIFNMLGDLDSKNTITSLARSKIAEIEAQGFDENVANTPRTAFNNPYDAYDYEITWTVLSSDVASATDAVLFRVALTIYWQSRGGERSETFITYLGRMNPY